MKGLLAELRRMLNGRGSEPTSGLSRIVAASCETSRLGTFNRRSLDEFFNCPQVANDWAADRRRIDLLNLPEMTGGVNPGDCQALYYLVRKLKPVRILEIGTHIGSSTIALALAAGRNTAEGVATQIVTVDIRDVNDPGTRPWIDAGSPASPRALLTTLELIDLVEFNVGTAVETLAEPAEGFCMIFLDGDHSAEAVYGEIPLALQRLSPTGPGVILLHDFFPGMRPLWTGQDPLPGPFQAIERFRSESANFDVLPLGELPWPTKLGSNLTSLAILTSSS